MMKFNINDKVKLKNSNEFYYGEKWQEFYQQNINTIFSIHSIDTIFYTLCYPNGEIVMNPINTNLNYFDFFYHELEPYNYNHINNTLPDELFEL